MPKKNAESGEPKFPYTTEPKALRRLLTEVPKRPKPPRVTMDTLKAWNVSSNNNARTAINVLKKIGLLGQGGEPTNVYVEFMKKDVGRRHSRNESRMSIRCSLTILSRLRTIRMMT